jgi:signal transduction histidine kinase
MHRSDSNLGPIMKNQEAEINTSEAGKELWENERLLRLSSEMANAAAWEYDAANDTIIRSINLERLYGLGKQIKWKWTYFIEAIHPEDRLKFKTITDSCLAIGGQDKFAFDFRILYPDKSIHCLSVIGEIIERSPEGLGKKMRAVNIDISKRKQVEEYLRESEENLRKTSEELRALSKHVEELIEKERTEIARDLHDDLGQRLTILNLNLSWIKSRMGVKSRGVVEKLESTEKLLIEATENMHHISSRLRPSILDNLGIKASIEWLLAELKKSTGISHTVSFFPKKLVINKEISLTVFRIIQECLTNVARHANAANVSVDLSIDRSDLKLIIKDDGTGIDKLKLGNSSSFGILGMRERAIAHGGNFQINGIKGKGTTIIVEIPRVN